jgi:hypothetical protein
MSGFRQSAPGDALDVQVFVNDETVALHPREGRLVVKVLSPVADALAKLRPSFHGLASAAFFFLAAER